MVAPGGIAELGRSEELPANSSVIPPRSSCNTLIFPRLGQLLSRGCPRCQTAGKHSLGARWSLPNPDPRATWTTAKPGCSITELTARSRRSCVTRGQGRSFAGPWGESLLGRKAGTCHAAAASHHGKSMVLLKPGSRATQGKAIAALSESGVICCTDSPRAGLVCLVRAVLQAGLSSWCSITSGAWA